MMTQIPLLKNVSSMGCIRTLAVTNLTPSYDKAQLGVVRCTLAQHEQVNNWKKKNVIFQTCTKIENKSCKVIVHSGSCINVIASKLITTLEIKPVKHPCTYKVTWSDATSINVQERCQIVIQFATYTNNVWCDMLPMNVGHVILGRSWSCHFGTIIVIWLRCDNIWTNQPLLIHP